MVAPKVFLNSSARTGSKPPAALQIRRYFVSREGTIASGREFRIAWCMVGAA